MRGKFSLFYYLLIRQLNIPKPIVVNKTKLKLYERGSDSMRVKTFQAFKDLSIKSAAIIVFIILWEIAPRIGIVDRMYLPPCTINIVLNQ